jgi:hypothetical protein
VIVPLVGVRPLRDLRGRADPHEGPRTETSFGVVRQSHGNRHDAFDFAFDPRSEGDASRSGLEWLERRFIVADPLRKEGNETTRGQNLVTSSEGGNVLPAPPTVSGPVDRDYSGELQEWPKRDDFEER